MKKGLCSIIVRTKNEERWIKSCLDMINKQTYKNFELILVDNYSTDKTVEKAKQCGAKKIIQIKDYLPGAAINKGISESEGEYIVCLSAHCIPINEHWLGSLVEALEENETIAGVYGRQEPMSYSAPADKRDLLLVFGLDKKIQFKDSFFHNANSIVRKSFLEICPFDEKTTNIEDRIWGQEMIDRGFQLVYEPAASVYHYHGIHQTGNEKRCKNVVRIIEDMRLTTVDSEVDYDNLLICAIVPIKGMSRMIDERHQLAFTLDAINSSKYISDVYIATDEPKMLNSIKSLGAKAIMRAPNLSQAITSTETVLGEVIKELDNQSIYPDFIVYLEETYPFREHDLIDNMIKKMVDSDFDSLIAAKYESRSIWFESEENGYTRIDSGDHPRLYKEKNFIGCKGLCCVTRPDVLRCSGFSGKKVGIFEVENQLSFMEIRSDKDVVLAKKIFDVFNVKDIV